MNALININIETETDIRTMKEHLGQVLTATIEGIKTAARIVKRVTELGEDVTEWGLGISSGRRDALINIADGILNVEVYNALGNKATLIKAMSRLPEAEQLRLANGGTIRILLSHNDGDFLQVPAADLTAQQIRQAFADTGGYRDQLSQLNWLAVNRKREKPVELPQKPTIEVGSGFILVNGVRLTTDDLLEYAIRTRINKKC
jgi:hypothetical protein